MSDKPDWVKVGTEVVVYDHRTFSVNARLDTISRVTTATFSLANERAPRRWRHNGPTRRDGSIYRVSTDEFVVPLDSPEGRRIWAKCNSRERVDDLRDACHRFVSESNLTNLRNLQKALAAVQTGDVQVR